MPSLARCEALITDDVDPASTDRDPTAARTRPAAACGDEVVPAQWFSQPPLQPEKRLMLAVLVDAIDIIVRRRGAANPHTRRQIDEAQRWLDSNNRRWPFSFRSVCEALDLQPHRLRQRLKRFRSVADGDRVTLESVAATRSYSPPGASDESGSTETAGSSSAPETLKAIALTPLAPCSRWPQAPRQPGGSALFGVQDWPSTFPGCRAYRIASPCG